MADDAAPYSGAIEESAKAAGKALDLIKDARLPMCMVLSSGIAFTPLVIGGWTKLLEKQRKS